MVSTSAHQSSSRLSSIRSIFETGSPSQLSPITPTSPSVSKVLSLSGPSACQAPCNAVNTLKKRRGSCPRSAGAISLGRSNSRQAPPQAQTFPLERKSSRSRPVSLLGSFRSLRIPNEPKATKASCPPFQFPPRPASFIPGPTSGGLSQNFADSNIPPLPPSGGQATEASYPESHVLRHGDVQTSTFMFRRKKGYLVLTATHLYRLKSQLKASEFFSMIPAPHNRTPSYGKHQRSASIGSGQDLLDSLQDPSMDKDFCLPLRDLVAVQVSDDARPSFALDVTYFDPSALHAATISFQFSTSAVRDAWLIGIRIAAGKACSTVSDPVPTPLVRSAARIIEEEEDYDVDNFSIYKVLVGTPPVHRGGARSADDISRTTASMVSFLVVGLYRIHLIPLSQLTRHASAPTLAEYTSHECYGILSLTHADFDLDHDTLDLTFRLPTCRPRSIRIMSLSAFDVAACLFHLEAGFRRNWMHPVCQFTHTCYGVSSVTPPSEKTFDSNLESFERLMSAYCVSYNVNPTNIRYRAVEMGEHGLEFVLLPPERSVDNNYNLYELLAVLRSLRSSEVFTSISFAYVNLDILGSVHDPLGEDHSCVYEGQVAGQADEIRLQTSSLLVHEIRALVTSNRSLRCLNFDSAVTAIFTPPEHSVADAGCGVVEAVFPACASSICKIHTVVLNNIPLSAKDSDLITQAISNPSCGFECIQMSNCGLTEELMPKLLQRIQAQDGSLKSLNISQNMMWLQPSYFQSQPELFSNLEHLDISNIAVPRGDESLFPSGLLCSWKLRTLFLDGIHCNPATVRCLQEYLRSPSSGQLQDLRLNRTRLTGRDVGDLLFALSHSHSTGRNMHLGVGENFLEEGHKSMVDAIASGNAPTSLSVRSTEYQCEDPFVDLLVACALNKTIRSLDIAQLRLPTDASDTACKALEYLFQANTTIECLDISGEISRLDHVRFGPGITDALRGLCHNSTLRMLWVENQTLGIKGASTLADVIQENSTLQELHCSHNTFPLSAFTLIVNSMASNRSVTYISDMCESKDHALRVAEQEALGVSDDNMPQYSPTSGAPSATAKFMKSSTRGMRSVVSMVAKGSVGRQPSISSQHSISSRISDQEVQVALRLMEKTWDLQSQRLHTYLERNRCTAGRVPVEESVVGSASGTPAESNDITTTTTTTTSAPTNSPVSTASSVGSLSEDDGLSLLETPPRALKLEVPKNSPVSPTLMHLHNRRVVVSELARQGGNMPFGLDGSVLQLSLPLGEVGDFASSLTSTPFWRSPLGCAIPEQQCPLVTE